MSEILRRQIAFRAEVGDEGLIKGYASLFNECLTDNAHCEIFAPGCWSKSIAALFDEPTSRGEPSRIAVNWAHDWGTPFAVPTVIREDATGLYTEARVKLFGAGEVNADRWAQVKAGLVTGLSVEIDPSRSVYEVLSEKEARDLGFTGEWSQWTAPRRWTEVYLLGWAYVLVPSMAGARVTEVRSVKPRATKGVRAMDEATKTEIMGLVAEACKPLMERLGALEAKMMPSEGEDGGEVEVVVGGDSEEMRSLKNEVAKLKADADEARFEAWRAVNAPALSAEVARHIYAASPAVRADLLKMSAPKSVATPNLPALGAGSGLREADALPKTAKEAWQAIKSKHGTDRAAAEAEWAKVREQFRN